MRTGQISDPAGGLFAISGVGASSRWQIDSPTLVEGALPGIVIFTPAGEPQGYATYDLTQDAAGPLGIRALRPSEYLNASLIANPTNGGTTPTRGNLRVSGPTVAQGAKNYLETLTLANGGALRLEKGQQLVLGQRSLFVESGTTGASVEGGTLTFGTESSSLREAQLLISGDLTVASALTDATFLRKYGSGTLTWSSPLKANTQIFVEAGTLRIGTPDALSAGVVSLNAGTTLRVPNFSASVGSIAGTGDVQLEPGSTLSINFTSTFAGAFHGSGTLRIGTPLDFSGNTFTATGVSDYTGPLLIEKSLTSFPGTTLLLNGSGRFTGVTEVGIQSGAKLIWQTATPVLPAHVPIKLAGGVLDLQTGTASLSAGTLTAQGLGTVSVKTNSTESVQFDFDDLAVSPLHGGQFVFAFGNREAGAAPGPGIANLRFGPGLVSQLVGSGSTPAHQPVIPFAVGNYFESPLESSPKFGLLTYSSSNGLRLLSSNEYASTMIAGANVRLSSATVQNTDITINSLTVTNGISNLSGSGTVHVQSGVLLAENSISSGQIFSNLNFGNQRGYFYFPSLSLNGKISGTAGLAINGQTWLENAANDFTGPLILNAGTVAYRTSTALGPVTNLIILNKGELAFAGFGDTTLNHSIELGPAGGKLGRGDGFPFNIAGTISGSGSLGLKALNLILTGANTYTGPTFVEQTVTLASAQGFGQTTLIDLQGTIRLAVPWAMAGGLGVASSIAIIDTNGFDATIAGPVTSRENYYALTKRGLGRLTLNDARGLISPVSLAVGTLQLNDRSVAISRAKWEPR